MISINIYFFLFLLLFSLYIKHQEKKKKNEGSILNKDDYIVYGHSHKLETDSSSNNQLNGIFAFESKEGGFGKEYYCERNEAEDDFHAFEYFLS